MKRILLPCIFLMCVVAVIVVSCTKKNNATGPKPGVNQVFSALVTTPQNFTITVGISETIRGADGTILSFYPNSFKDKSGNIITSGNVSLSLMEMYTPGDMMANRAATVTGSGAFLQSSGQIRITATMNGEEVFANKYGVAFMKMGTGPSEMMLYYGSNQNNDSLVTWTMSDTAGNPGAVATSADSVTYGGNVSLMYVFDTATNFNYINCDLLPGTTTQSTRIFITMPDGSYTLDNTEVFLVIPSLNSMTQNRIGSYDAATHTIKFGDDGSQVPVGVTYELAIITNKNGSYYYDEISGTTTAADMTLTAAMAPETLGDILSRIHAL